MGGCNHSSEPILIVLYAAFSSYILTKGEYDADDVGAESETSVDAKSRMNRMETLARLISTRAAYCI